MGRKDDPEEWKWKNSVRSFRCGELCHMYYVGCRLSPQWVGINRENSVNMIVRNLRDIR